MEEKNNNFCQKLLSLNFKCIYVYICVCIYNSVYVFYIIDLKKFLTEIIIFLFYLSLF